MGIGDKNSSPIPIYEINQGVLMVLSCYMFGIH